MSNPITVVAVVGSRKIDEEYVWDNLHETLRRCKLHPHNCILISGGANGVDTIAKNYAKKWYYWFVEVPADWSQGKRAGYMRNQVLALADIVIAYWYNESKGTKHTIDLAIARQKRLFINGKEHIYETS